MDRLTTLYQIEKASGSIRGRPSFQVTLRTSNILELRGDPLVSFGVHTHNHMNLGMLSNEKAQIEIASSKLELERLVNRECKYFSYPIGKRSNFNDETKKILSDEGFLAAVTTIPGRISRKSNLLELRRISVPNDSAYRFKCSLIGFALQRS